MNSKIQKIIEQINQLSNEETAELRNILYKLWGHQSQKPGQSFQRPKIVDWNKRLVTSYRKSKTGTLSGAYIRISRQPKKISQVSIRKFRAGLNGDRTTSVPPPVHKPKPQPKPAGKPVKKTK